MALFVAEFTDGSGVIKVNEGGSKRHWSLELSLVSQAVVLSNEVRRYCTPRCEVPSQSVDRRTPLNLISFVNNRVGGIVDVWRRILESPACQTYLWQMITNLGINLGIISTLKFS